MFRLRDLPISRKLTLIMMTVSCVVLLLACLYFFVFDVVVFRNSMTEHLYRFAGITGANVATSLTYRDPNSDELVLQSLNNESNIIGARVADIGLAAVLYWPAAWPTGHALTIRFWVEDNKVRFETNLRAAERAKIKISSRLLLLAKNVVKNRGAG